MNQITGAQALVRTLQAAGVEVIFAVPGVQLDWIFHALEREHSPIRVVVPRHEQATTYMADGYSRTSGKVGVALVVPGPGVLNAMAGLATAYASHSRVLLLAGHIHSKAIGQELGLLHEIRGQDAVLRAATKKTITVTQPGDVASATVEALQAIDEGRRGPVALQLPPDVLAGRFDGAPAAPKPPANPPPVALDAGALERAASLLRQARSPLICAGGGVAVAKAGAPLRALAERLQAPVVMTENARGLLADEHPLALSVLGGQQAFKDADVVLVAGSRFVDLVTGQPVWQSEGVTYIGLNIDAKALAAPRHFAVSLVADAATGLAALAQALGELPASAERSQRVERIAGIQAQAREKIAALGTLAAYVQALRAGIPREATLVNELTQVGYLCRVAYPLHAPETLITPGYQGTLGYAFPTGLGAAVGAKRRVYAISGDGGFGWNLQELATAARYSIPLTMVVFNDRRFTNVHALQTAQFGFSREVALHNPDFRQLAEAFGVAYASADSPAALTTELARSEALTGPLLIEVPVGDMANPWPLLRLQAPPASAHQPGDTP